MAHEKIVLETADRRLAHSLAGALENLIEPPPAALTLFEEPGAPEHPAAWRIEVYYDSPRDAAALGCALRSITGSPVPEPRTEPVPDLNWVAISQAALPPVRAGRFTVRGTHDRARVPRGPHTIEIDAGEAFGTAHHATTHGCLSAIDMLTRRRPPRSVLDLGCGSGVLAIALARALPRARILASDLDRRSVEVARANMQANGTSGRIRTLVASGLDAPALRRRGAFDLVVANILAGPLRKLSGAVSAAVRPGGHVVLSGVLIPESPAVIAAYLAHGFHLERHSRLAGWSTLVLRRRDPAPRSSVRRPYGSWMLSM